MQRTEQDCKNTTYSAESYRVVRDNVWFLWLSSASSVLNTWWVSKYHRFHRYMEAYFCNKDYGDESEWSHVVAIKVVTRKLKAFVFSDKDEGFF